MKVIKFGGTSVGSVENMNKVMEIIKNDERKIVVLSAMSGTTNSLIEISTLVEKNHDAGKQIDELHNKYNQVVQDLYAEESTIQSANKRVEQIFDYIRSISENKINEPLFGKKIVIQGEILSTFLFHLLLTENKVENQLLSSLDFMYKDLNGEPDMQRIETELKAILKSTPQNIIITQGFICRDHNGNIDNLDRGGSDYTASIIGAVLKAIEIQIWTDIDGFHNNDPRFVDKTKPIPQLSFEEAAELAYFGAKILHPQSVLPAEKANIPVLLKKTTEPKAEGTIILKEAAKDGIKAIAAKDGITAVRIKSARMLLAYGFLESVFAVFSRNHTSIDMITTSEIAISLTIDNTKNINEIFKELSEFSTVEIENGLTIVSVVGQKITSDKSVSHIFKVLDEIPVRMISYGGSKNNISLLVKEEDKAFALKKLNELLF